MILLVVGLVAVIVVIFIAVFLSIRLGRGDEHDDEPDIRLSSRDQRAEEDRWGEPGGRDARRRSARPAQAGARGADERYGSRDDDRRRNGEPAYSGAREPGPARRASERDYEEPRRPARRDSSGYEASPGRRRPADVSAESRGRYDEVPSHLAATDDFHAADYPSGEYSPVDFPRRESMDYAGDDFPSEELPAARPAKRSAAKARPEADHPSSRRKTAPVSAPGKGRSRQRGKRDDADDWPTSEWDKLSDEQYWAELSADKPLSTMAKPAKPGSSAMAVPAAAPASPESLPRTPSHSPVLASEEREMGRGGRERPRHEPATERLPVRSRQHSPVPAARSAEVPAASRPVPAGTHPSLDTGPLPTRDPGRHPSLDTGPLPTRDPGRHPSLDTGPLPTRDAGRHPSLDTGPLPTRDPGRHPSLDTGPYPALDPSLVTPRGLPRTPRPRVPGALEDDPLTSPSFSMKADPATDSRSYRHSRKAPQADASTGNGPAGPSAHPLTGNGAGRTGRHHSGGYPAGDYGSPAYTHSAQPAPAPAVPAEWYSAPPAEPAPTPAYGNPYGYRGASTTGPPASPAGDPGHAGYLADPMRVYSPPPYESPASTSPEPYPAHSALGMAAPANGAAHPQTHPERPYGQEYGQLQPPPYPDASGGTGYAPRYDGRHGSDRYTAGGYGPYPPQG